MNPKAIVAMLLPLAVGLASGCEILGLEDEVEVRVRNGSNLVLDEAVLFLPKATLEFSQLHPGADTPYQVVEKAYRIASAEVVLGQDTSRVQVIDYVGERPLDGGRYTYVLSFFEGNPESLIIELEKDS